MHATSNELGEFVQKCGDILHDLRAERNIHIQKLLNKESENNVAKFKLVIQYVNKSWDDVDLLPPKEHYFYSSLNIPGPYIDVCGDNDDCCIRCTIWHLYILGVNLDQYFGSKGYRIF